MADITMCTNDSCPLAPTCYRVQAPTNELWQARAHFDYIIDDEGTAKCYDYWPMRFSVK